MEGRIMSELTRLTSVKTLDQLLELISDQESALKQARYNVEEKQKVIDKLISTNAELERDIDKLDKMIKTMAGR